MHLFLSLKVVIRLVRENAIDAIAIVKVGAASTDSQLSLHALHTGKWNVCRNVCRTTGIFSCSLF